MAAITSNQLIIHGLQKSQTSALRKKAERLGLTAEDYVRDLIAADLELDRAASTSSFAELAMPFQKSLDGLTNAELDKAARPRGAKAKR
jgi:hypothetical protein